MPAPAQKTDAIVVLTGGPGRIDRALELLEAGQAKRLLISGAAREVQPRDVAAQYTRPHQLFDCGLALGIQAEGQRPLDGSSVGEGGGRSCRSRWWTET